jgi:hypothetical protein
LSAAPPNGDRVRDPGETFDYKVLFEWGGNVELRHMNRIAPIADFVIEKLANIGVVDVEERPEPDIARITIERVTAETKEEASDDSTD